MSDARKVRAAKLRAEGLNYHEIARRVGVAHTTVRRWLDAEAAEADRAWSRAWKARNVERRRAYEESLRVECVDCGAPVHRRSERCARCYAALQAARGAATAKEFERLWNEGRTLREIAAHFGWSPGHANEASHRYRQQGYDLPYRRRTYAGRPLVAKTRDAA